MLKVSNKTIKLIIFALFCLMEGTFLLVENNFIRFLCVTMLVGA